MMRSRRRRRGPRGGLGGGQEARRNPRRGPRVLEDQAGCAPVPSRGRVPLLDSNPHNRGLGGSTSFHRMGGSRSQLRRPPHRASLILLKFGVLLDVDVESCVGHEDL